jgi:tetratricopeptide (TPR) repeat protein
LDQNFTKGYLRLANCHFQRGRFSQSKNYFNIALKLEPNNRDALEGISKIEKVSKIINEAKNFLVQNEYQKSLNKCEEGLQLSGENDTLYLIQADALVKLKRYGEAIKIST